MVWYPEYQNSILTLLVGVLALYLLEKLKKKHVVLSALAIGLMCGAAWLLRCDYGAVGVLLICVMYLFRNDRKVQMLSGAVISAVESYAYCGVAALSYGLLWFYNGRRGDFPMKYFFYFAYPLHLALFYALVWLGNR